MTFPMFRHLRFASVLGLDLYLARRRLERALCAQGLPLKEHRHTRHKATKRTVQGRAKWVTGMLKEGLRA